MFRRNCKPLMTTRFALKAATDDVHRELDGRLSKLNLSSRADYCRFLQIQARAVPAIEQALTAGGLDDLVRGWSDSRRAPSLESDLAKLGESMPPAAKAPTINSVPELLGTAYVLEGSRLGGRVLQKQIADGSPATFLDGSLGAWPALLEALDRFLYSDALIGEAKDAARRCFALFLNVAHEAGI